MVVVVWFVGGISEARGKRGREAFEGIWGLVQRLTSESQRTYQRLLTPLRHKGNETARRTRWLECRWRITPSTVNPKRRAKEER